MQKKSAMCFVENLIGACNTVPVYVVLYVQMNTQS